MHCEQCGVQMTERRATDKAPYRYGLSGLPNVELVGIQVYECPRCRDQRPHIPHVEELHRRMAEGLLEQPDALRGEEIRFLRKYLALPSKQFAAWLRISPSHFSKIEHNKEHLSPAVDKLIRILVAHVMNNERAKDLLFDHTKQVAANKRRRPKAPVFKLERNHWTTAA